eukprot:3716081-Lingulodinium_polyedra.AAC.1
MARSFALCVAAQMRGDAKPFTPHARQKMAHAWCERFGVGARLERGWSAVGTRLANGWKTVGERSENG